MVAFKITQPYFKSQITNLVNYNFQFPESTEATVEVDVAIQHLESACALL